MEQDEEDGEDGEEDEEGEEDGDALLSLLSDETLARLLGKLQQAAASGPGGGGQAPESLEEMLDRVELDERDLLPQEIKVVGVKREGLLGKRSGREDERRGGG
jgi:hypothetical protein